MKVVHLTTAHLASDIRIFHKECVTLAAHGHDVVLVAPRGSVPAPVSPPGLAVVEVPRISGRLGRVLLTGARVVKAALSQDPDVCHVHDPELLLWAPRLRLAGCHVIYDMHECTVHSIGVKPWIPAWARPTVSMAFRLAERVLAHDLTVIFAEDSYVEDYPWVRRSAVVLNMPLTDQLTIINGPPSPRAVMAYLGAVSEDRGAIVTVEALRILRERGVDAGWLLIGASDDVERRPIEALVRQYGLAGCVAIHGWIPPQQAWEMIAGSCCGLATLLPRQTYRDSYPTKMFEYMALGIPVVASDFPLYRRVVEGARCGLCVDPENPVAVADAVGWILQHPDESREMGQNGRRAVLERYSWATQGRILTDMYDRIARECDGPWRRRQARHPSSTSRTPPAVSSGDRNAARPAGP